MQERSSHKPARRKRALCEQKETGITPKHARSCTAKGWDEENVCNCTPTFAPWVYNNGKISYGGTFPTIAAAKSWRTNALADKNRGLLRETTKILFGDAADALIEGMKSGTAFKRGGESYKPKVIRDYEAALKRLKVEFGPHELAKIRRKDGQRYADALLAQGLSPSRVKNILMPAQVIYRRAIRDDDVSVNPFADLELPAAKGVRDRVADPKEAGELLVALSEADQTLWATALYAGPRMSELRALKVENDHGTYLEIERSWDDVEGEIATKSAAGVRKIPVCDQLRSYLDAHRTRLGRDTGLLFGETATTPFNYGRTTRRAYAAWKKAKLERITMHNCRHSFRSYLDYAGISEARCDRYLGHSNSSIGRRYTHNFESQLADDAAKLDAYLEGATEGKVVALAKAS